MRLGPVIAVIACAAALGGCGSKTVTVVSTVNGPPTTSSSGSVSTTTPSTTTSSSTASSTTATTATATVHRSAFRSPTGNIGCILLGGTARCDISKRSWSPPPHPASCSQEVDFGQGLLLGKTGPGGFVCAGDTALDPSAPKLAYGSASVSDGFTCLSTTAGMTCTRGGHGFFISEQSYRKF